MSARKLKAGWPSPRLALRDPMALRALVLILAVASFFAAGDERIKRITAAFDWQGVVGPANFRIDAWITPPAYTGRPPVMLAGLRPGETPHAVAPVAVPAGSQLVIRATGNVHFDVTRKGGIENAPPDPHAPLPAGTEERRFLVKGDGSAVLHGVAGGDLAWTFTAIPDRPPTIALIKDPERQARGSLRLDYKMDDDYGVVDARATFALAEEEQTNKTPHPLFKPPEFSLTLPQARTRNGAAQTTHDLTEHPWAGAKVNMTLVARDEAGNEGRSEPHELHVAAAHLRQAGGSRAGGAAPHSGARCRREAAGARRARCARPSRRNISRPKPPSISACVRSISIWPTPSPTMRCAKWRRACGTWRCRSRTAMSARPNRPCARRRRRLRQALERGASDEELKKLMQQLRAAMDKFLQAMMEQMQKNPQQLARPLDHNTRMLSQQDLKSMLDRLENLARSGNKDAARQLLDELQSMLENLQTAQPGAKGERRRRRHDVGARRARRHDPQAAAIARQDLQGRSGHRGATASASRQGRPEEVRRSASGSAGLEGPAQEAARAIAPARARQMPTSRGQAGPERPEGKARWTSSAAPAKPWARPKANSARATPRARSTPRAARSKPCARARRAGAADAAERHGHGPRAARPQRPPARRSEYRSARPAAARPRIRTTTSP